MCCFCCCLNDKMYKLRVWFEKNWMVVLPIIFFLIVVILLIICLYNHLSEKLIDALIAAEISAFGLIFVGLKFKLDRASFEKSLFEKRYTIFNIVNEVLWKWASVKNEPLEKEELEDKLNGSIINKSYFLFSKKTYNEVKKMREHLISTNDARKTSPALRISAPEIREAEEYLNKLIDEEKLFKIFPQLKVDF